ncbi:substrate-binding domain-containing protein [Natrarchaeobaculum sulfurireducens]|uniref:ABC-type tungstate transport system, permease component n=1 Tax=Natrarchaeobaculum sulfurireducens TaxID=2044521 RepID=A0A346PG60_9EURY|nr:substrate-binding domain-containing protein [Natrarchaeobaculum sulfurireducens]AXR78505.1 ABC-type tungstate transport system, permease component [Natrarchaeobaculum sulfurireducens]
MPIHRRGLLAGIGGGTAVGLAGCTALGGDDVDSGPEIVGETLTLSTTTSTYHTGLLDELNVAFEDRYGVTVDTVPQGTGAAIQTGRSGDSDVVMVHARSQEDEFMADGYGINRREIMFNDFIIIGDPDDPAEISGGDDAVEAFVRIADSDSMFVSRGDDSGTHTRELEIWEEAGFEDGNFGEWYREAGGGMGEVVIQTGQRGGYTLADRGTYLSMSNESDLEIHVEGPVEDGPEILANPYGIFAINPEIHDTVDYGLAMAYIGFITSLEGQAIIEGYTVEGEQLFFPEALTEDPNFEQYVPEGWDGSDSNE